MPVRRQIPEHRRRSRKGCIPCRRRRRKCDERRPSCANCASRDVACEYGGLTFVSSRLEASRSLEVPLSNDQHQSHVHETSYGTPTTHISSAYAADEDHSPALADSTSLPPPWQNTSPSFVRVYSRVEAHDTSPCSNSSLSKPVITACHDVVKPARWNDPDFPHPDSSSKQAALLRFRYQLAPWIDANDGKSAFGQSFIKLAHERDIITDCILYCSRFRDRRSPILIDTDADVEARQGILRRLSQEDDFTAEAGRALLVVSDLFITPTSRWDTLGAAYCSFAAHNRLREESFEAAAEPLRTLWRLLLKIDLSASIINNKPPSSMLPVPANREYLSTSATGAYDYCLSTLAEALTLVHRDLIPLLSGSDGPHVSAVELASKWTEWSTLWTRCVDWFRERPRAMEPVLEGSETDVTEDEPFPPDVYTSALALRANLLIHMSALVLLVERPRLAQTPDTASILLSRSWHARKIARMEVWNDFDEQWDPLVVAALLYVSREMTHASQQQAIVACFQRIVNATQIPLEEDVSDLRSFWRYASGSEAPPL